MVIKKEKKWRGIQKIVQYKVIAEYSGTIMLQEEYFKEFGKKCGSILEHNIQISSLELEAKRGQRQAVPERRKEKHLPIQIF